MEKKNPYIMTIGFKKEDPDHVYVAEFLNSLGRGKAQYIVKAVLHIKMGSKMEKFFSRQKILLTMTPSSRLCLK